MLAHFIQNALYDLADEDFNHIFAGLSIEQIGQKGYGKTDLTEFLKNQLDQETMR